MLKNIIVGAVLLQMVLGFRIGTTRKFGSIYNSSFTWNPIFVENGTQSINLNHSLVTFNMDLDVIKVARNLSVFIGAYMFDKNRKLVLVNETYEWCDLMVSSKAFSFHFFVQKIYNTIKRSTNLYICVHQVCNNF